MTNEAIEKLSEKDAKRVDDKYSEVKNDSLRHFVVLESLSGDYSKHEE